MYSIWATDAFSLSLLTLSALDPASCFSVWNAARLCETGSLPLRRWRRWPIIAEAVQVLFVSRKVSSTCVVCVSWEIICAWPDLSIAMQVKAVLTFLYSPAFWNRIRSALKALIIHGKYCILFHFHCSHNGVAVAVNGSNLCYLVLYCCRFALSQGHYSIRLFSSPFSQRKQIFSQLNTICIQLVNWHLIQLIQYQVVSHIDYTQRPSIYTLYWAHWHGDTRTIILYACFIDKQNAFLDAVGMKSS